MSDNENQDKPESERGYLLLVGSLLLVICAALAVLWMTERRRRIRAETQIVKMLQTRQTRQNVLQQQALRGLARPDGESPPGPTSRPN